jgi:hypothetical protein
VKPEQASSLGSAARWGKREPSRFVHGEGHGKRSWSRSGR